MLNKAEKLAVILGLAFAVAAVPARAGGMTTFAEFDRMQPKEQKDFRTSTILKLYRYLYKTNPAQAQCLREALKPEEDGFIPAVAKLDVMVEKVPTVDRKQAYFEVLATNHFTGLCPANNELALK